MQDFWLVHVYCKDGLSGNLTRVILNDTPLTPHVLQAIATGFFSPDTAFAWTAPGGILIHRTYFPYEELQFCTQALLATAAVQRPSGGALRVCFPTMHGGRTTVSAEREGSGCVEATPAPARAFPDTVDLLRRLRIDERMMAGLIAVPGIGAVASMSHSVRPTLYSPTPPAAAVASPARIPLRVLTTFLGGAEGPATGGATLSIMGYDRLHPLHLTDVVTAEHRRTRSY